MQNQTHITAQAIRYIEGHLNGKLELETVAAALHYSKFYLHRCFTKTVGLTVHDYVQRRQLTQAAKFLVFSRKPILEIALMSGYESQQAFTGRFKALYKMTPGDFREAEAFYPLQLELHLKELPAAMDCAREAIHFAGPEDMEDWMELVRLTVDGYPCLDQVEYRARLRQYIASERALILRDGGLLIGAMGFSTEPGSIDYLAIHPQYRHQGLAQRFLDCLSNGLLRGQTITVTTFRAGDRADTGYREEYHRMGFVERELLVEYGYPVQRFVFPPENKREASDG